MVTYVFSDANRRTSYISDAELNLRGTWAAGTTYSPPIDAVSYSGALWIAVQATANLSPTTYSKVRYWSQLVTYKTSPPPTDVTRAQATADAAYALAQEGTNAVQGALSVAQSGTAGASQAFLLAVAGTNLARHAEAVADSGTAGVEQVYPIAVAGTNLAILALSWLGTHSQSTQLDLVARQTAWSGTAGVEQLLGLFTQGTGAGTIYTDSAVLAEAVARIAADANLQAQINSIMVGGDSYLALVTSWSGTAGVEQLLGMFAQGTQAGTIYTDQAVANFQSLIGATLATAWSGTAGVEQVYPIAVAGTNLAQSAYTLAQTAYNLITSGTDATAALARANEAYGLATYGTAGVEQVYPIAISGTAGVEQVYPIATSGTAGVQQVYAIATAGTVAASQAASLASQAYALASIGTNVGTNAYNLASAGSNLAQAAWLLAQQGTTTLASTGTLPASAAISGTLYFDFAGSASDYQTTTVDRNLWISAKNMAAGREIAAILAPDAGLSAHWLGFAPFKWFGTTPPGTLSTKEIVIAMTAFDTTVGNVRAAPTVQV